MTERQTLEEFVKELRGRHPVVRREPWKEASVLATHYYVRVVAMTMHGMGREDPDAFEAFLPPTPDDLSLGIQVRAALAASTLFNLGDEGWNPTSQRYDTSGSERRKASLLAAAGIKSMSRLLSGAGQVSVDLKDGGFRLAPVRRQHGDCWLGLPGNKSLTLPGDAPDEALGAAVREGLALSR